MILPNSLLSSQHSETLLRFSLFSLLPDGTLLCGGDPIQIPPKELAVLRLLVANAGQIVAHQQLQEAGWGNVHVSQDSLPKCISSLRGRLNSEKCIQTVYKRGYRFTLPVELTPIDRQEKQREGAEERRVFPMPRLLRLAILPFASSANVPEGFGSGVAEETMLKLNRANPLAVEILARDSVFLLAAKGLAAAEVGKTLGADLALTGTITPLPRHFRLRAEMIRVRDGVQLWVEDFLLPRELLAYADARLAKRISARIRRAFASPIAALSFQRGGGTIAYAAAGAAPESDLSPAKVSKAYSVFLQARHEWNSLERNRMQDAVLGFERATEMDSSFQSARINLIHGYLYQAFWGYLSPEAAAKLARHQAEILVGSGDSTRSLWAALGWIQFFYDRDLAAAARSFKDTCSSGYDPMAFRYCSRFHLGQGQFSKAIDLLQTALAADPYSAGVQTSLMWAYHMAGDTRSALALAEGALELFPAHPPLLVFSSLAMAAAGSPGDRLTERATELATKVVLSRPNFDGGISVLAYAYARHGRIEEARKLIERQMSLSQEHFVMRSVRVPALVALGEFDLALEELSLSEGERCPWFLESLHDPRLEPLHGRPEFQRLQGIAQSMGASISAA
jgi:DNA-binding winged helix-turn-helix (wHTH) protein/tetratricopeptide (TPR) repeat protein